MLLSAHDSSLRYLQAVGLASSSFIPRTFIAAAMICAIKASMNICLLGAYVWWASALTFLQFMKLWSVNKLHLSLVDQLPNEMKWN